MGERYGYDPHGRMTILVGNGTTVRSVPACSLRFTYASRGWDEDLNVCDVRARMDNAQLGRFLSRDPFGYVDGCTSNVRTSPRRDWIHWDATFILSNEPAMEKVITLLRRNPLNLVEETSFVLAGYRICAIIIAFELGF